MKPLNLLHVILPSLALAFVACSNSNGKSDGGSSSSSSGFSHTSSSSSSGSGTTSGSSSSSSGSSSSGLHVGSPCTPPATATAKDPCAASGYQCAPNATGTGGTCQIPTEFGTCTTAVGCAAPDTCTNGDSIFGTGTGYLCLQTCTASAECVNALENCLQVAQTGPKYCIENLCGPVLPSGYPANGTGYYMSCDAQGTGDGTCIPVPDNTLGTTGICVQAGTAPLSGPCDQNRDDAGLASQCPLDTFCVMDSQSGNSICSPMCGATGYPGEFDGGTAAGDAGAADAGTADAGSAFSGLCSSADTCLDYTGGFFDFGVCLGTCTTGGTNTCTTPLTCQQATASGTAGVCFP